MKLWRILSYSVACGEMYDFLKEKTDLLHASKCQEKYSFKLWDVHKLIKNTFIKCTDQKYYCNFIPDRPPCAEAPENCTSHSGFGWWLMMKAQGGVIFTCSSESVASVSLTVVHGLQSQQEHSVCKAEHHAMENNREQDYLIKKYIPLIDIFML